MARHLPHVAPLTRLAVASEPADDAVLRGAAEALAAQLGLPLLPQSRPLVATAGGPVDAALVVTPTHRELRVLDAGHELAEGKPLVATLTNLQTHTPAGQSLKQPLARAVGLARHRERHGAETPLQILDATAGLGEDSWLLAALGCNVVAVERHPVIAALLEDALARAAAVAPQVAIRITLHTGSARDVLEAVARGRTPLPQPDVVYLDPMFTAPRKTAERRPMKLIRALAGPDADADELLPLARAVAARTVVKRPRHATPLGDEAPVATHEGKSLRYDVYGGLPRG